MFGNDIRNGDKWDVESNDTVAAYIRRSTFDQENDHQMQAIAEWLEDNDLRIGDIKTFEETASGADRDREQFQALIDEIEGGVIDHVVVWELSRIARNGLLAQEFFNLCEERDVVIHVTDGKVITPDGRNRFVADVYASIYADERRTLIRRTKMGQKRALENGHWVGKPPLGFTTDEDGYLIPNVEIYETYQPEQAGYYEVEGAIEELEYNDASFRSVSMGQNFSRPAITNVYKDEDKRKRYLEREAEDDRVQAALDELNELEQDGKPLSD